MPATAKKPTHAPLHAVDAEIVTPATAFAYAALEENVAVAAKVAAECIRAELAETKKSLFEIGRQLIAVKEKLPHGEFGKWIDAEFRMAARTAQNYMNAAKLADKYETVSVLPPKIIYAIAAPSIPPEVKDKIIAQIESTPSLPVDAIEHVISTEMANHTTEKAQAEKLKGKTPEQIAKSQKAKAKRQAAEAAKEKAEKEARQQAAADAVAMLRERLQADFQQFLKLAEKAQWSLRDALRDASHVA